MSDYFRNNSGEVFYKFFVNVNQVIMSKIDDDGITVTIYDTHFEEYETCSVDVFLSKVKERQKYPAASYIEFDLTTERGRKDIIKNFPQLFCRLDNNGNSSRLVMSDNPFLLDPRNKVWRKINGSEEERS